MNLVELSDYTLAFTGKEGGIEEFYFTLSRGDVFSVLCSLPDNARMFLRALATLVHPVKGTYRFRGKKIDFSNYRKLLPYKKRIGYIASDSAMISNMTVRENLLLGRYYFENSLSLKLDENTLRLCNIFDIHDKLDLYPGELQSVDLQIAIAIRELIKQPYLLLLERPEDFISHAKFNLFTKILKDMLLSGLSVVFISYNKNFVKELSNKKILIAGRTLTKVLT